MLFFIRWVSIYFMLSRYRVTFNKYVYKYIYIMKEWFLSKYNLLLFNYLPIIVLTSADFKLNYILNRLWFAKEIIYGIL